MTSSRNHLQRAINHQATARPPIDFGGTAVTGIHVSVVAALRGHYGLERRPVKVLDPYQMLGEVEDDLALAMGLDVVGVRPRNTRFGFPLADWKDWHAPWGQDLLVPGGFQVSIKGQDYYIHPQGDRSAPPSGHLPEGGYYFDAIVRQEPIQEEKLDPTDNIEEFGLLTEADLAHFARETERVAATGRGVIANFGGMALGDIAQVPAPGLKHPKGIRDVAEWYMSTALRPDYIRAVFDRQVALALANLASVHAVVGNRVDVIFLCGTDFGTQLGQFCSPATFDDLWLPYYKRMNDWIHAHTTWKTFKHSCGAIEPLLSRLIAAGFDIINPVQCSAAGMDAEELKTHYGDRLVFWGGGVDTQSVLPFGKPAEVREQVLRRCEILSKQGGFVFNAVHNIQARTPVANITAMIDAVHEFGGTGPSHSGQWRTSASGECRMSTARNNP